MRDHVVVGTSVASLVAAERLASAGDRVTVIGTDSRWGGSFASMKWGEWALPLGVRMMELAFEETTDVLPPLADYDVGVGHRPLVGHVAKYVSEMVGGRIEEADPPLMHVNDALAPDIYFTTDLSGLSAVLRPKQRRAMEAEVRELYDHARPGGVLTDSRSLEDLSLCQASLANHGETFHDLLIAPLVNRVLASSGDDVPADLRRKVWAPLFWPSTLLEAVTGRAPSFKPHRPLHTVTDGGTGAVITAVLERLKMYGATVVSGGKLLELFSGAGGLSMRFEDAGVIEHPVPVVGLSAAEIFGACGIEFRPVRATSAIAWISVDEADAHRQPSVLTVVSPSIEAFRVSCETVPMPGRVLYTVETSCVVPPERIAEVASDSIRRLGLVAPGAAVEVIRAVAIPSFPYPSFANREAFRAARAAFDERGCASGATIVGGAAAFGADTFSDQIVQGLKAAEELLA